MRFPADNAVMALFVCGILAVTPSAVIADYESGINYFKAGKYAEAAAEFQAMVEEAPEYDYGFYILGLSFLKMKKPADAATNFNKALELNGDKFEYYHGLAQAYNATGNHRKVIETLDGAEGLVPDEYRYHFFSMRGLAYASLKKWSQSIEDLEKAVKLKKSEPIYSQIGKAYFQLRHYDKAAEAFRGALALDPNDATGLQFLAESLMNLGSTATNSASKQSYYDDALEAAQKYRSKKRSDFDAINLVGRAALGAGKFDAALLAFDEALKIKPDYCFAMVNRSKCYIAKEQWQEADKALVKAASCSPNMALIYDSRGFVLRKLDKLDESLAAYEKAYSIKPSAATKQSIAEVRNNIEVRDFNKAAADKEEAQRIAAQKAEEEYRKELEKQEAWKKKTDDQ